MVETFPIISTMIFTSFIGAVVVYLLGKVGDRAVRYASLILSLFIFALALYSYGLIYVEGTGADFNFVERWSWLPAFKGLDYYVGMDGLGGPLVLVSSFLTVLVVLGSWELIRFAQPSYYALIFIFLGAIIGVFTALNLILFYVFWEMVLIPMFFFIGVWGGPKRKYAAMKFFIFTFFGGVVMLLAFLGAYLFADVASPTFNIPELYGKIPATIQLFASIATLIGFGIKLPIVPFHTWLPDAHVEAPSPVSVLLAGILLKMGGYGFIRVNLGLFSVASFMLKDLYIAIAIITMFYGAIVALIQRDLKRMVALTSINHMGFVLLGAYTGNLFGYSGAVFQMFNHACAIGLLFMLSGFIHEQAGTRDLSVLRGMKLQMPRTSSLFILGALAAIGAPFYSNFISEVYVIVGAISVNVGYAITILIPGITAAYFLWAIRRAVLSRPKGELKRHDLSSLGTFSLFLYLIPLFLFLAIPSLMLDVINPQALVYLGFFGGG